MRWSLLLVAALTLSGCSGDDRDVQATDEATELGTIRGVVVDATITPIAGALVTIENLNLTSETDEGGAFGFTGLPLGVYALEVVKEGYETVRQDAEAVAEEEPSPVRIQLEAIPGLVPLAVTYEDTGVIACGWGIPITYDYCGEELGVEDDPHLEYLIDGMPDYIQVEIIWESTQPASDTLYLIQAACPPENRDRCPGSIAAGARWGEGTHTSPAVMRTADGFLKGARDQFDDDSTDGWWVGVDVTADGPILPNGQPTATGVTIDQQFTGYVTMFWNIQPDEDWAFHKDGAYPY